MKADGVSPASFAYFDDFLDLLSRAVMLIRTVRFVSGSKMNQNAWPLARRSSARTSSVAGSEIVSPSSTVPQYAEQSLSGHPVRFFQRFARF